MHHKSRLLATRFSFILGGKCLLKHRHQVAGISSGSLFLSIRRGGNVQRDGMTSQAIRDVVAEYSKQIGLTVAPHDLRRSFAKLAHKGGAPIDQIQLSLGHSSIQTTERYLGVDQNLHSAPCDVLGLR